MIFSELARSFCRLDIGHDSRSVCLLVFYGLLLLDSPPTELRHSSFGPRNHLTAVNLLLKVRKTVHLDDVEHESNR